MLKNYTKFVFILVLFYCKSIYAQPNTISGLSLWLKADYGVTTSGSNVTSWLDASGNNNHCTQTNVSEQPTFNQNVASINYKNSLVFDGIDDWMPFTNQITDIRTVFFLIKHSPSSSNFEPLLGDIAYQDFQGDDYPVTNRIFHPSAASQNILNGSIRVNEINITPVSAAQRPSNYAIVSLTTTANVVAGRITRDRGIGSRVWAGEYCEIIIYDRALNTSEVATIENYLANKYAGSLNLGPDITINQGTGCVPSNTINLQANPNFQSYQWSTGINDTLDYITASQYGEYSVICKDNFGIFRYDTIKISPAPKAFNYPNSILCSNTTITWNTLLNKSENIFSWQGGTNDSLFIINSPGQYYLTITDTFGCAFNSDTLTVLQDNFPSQVSLGPDLSLCAGNLITLTAGASPSLIYTWSTNSNNDSLLITNSGQYSVIVTNTNNCIAKDTINVTVVGQAPTANFSSTIGCLNSLVNFSNLSMPPMGNTIDSTIWSFGDPLSASNSSTLTSPAHTYTSTGTYTVSLKVITDAGCTQSITKQIIVSPVPTASFVAGTSCQNDNTTFMSQSAGTTGYSITNTYWNFGDVINNTSNLIAPNHVFSNFMTYTVKLVVTNSAGCKDSINKPVFVNAEVKASFTNGPPCFNNPILFQSTSIIPPAPYTPTYLWNFPNSSTNTQNTIKTFTNSGVYYVTLTVDGTNGCTSSITKLIDVYLPPIASFSVPSFCSKDTINPLNLSLPQSGIMSSYNWRLNNTTFSAIQSPTLSVTTAGTYSVRLTVANSFGCKDSTTKSFTVYPLPIVDFTTNPAAYYYLNEPVNFVPTITNASSYLWNISGAPTSTLQSPTETFSTQGTYTVSLNLKDQLGCKGSKIKTITVTKRHLDLAILNVTTTKDNDGFMTVIADLANYGSVPISSFKIDYQISDGGNIKETWNGNLNPNSFYVFTFNATSASVQNSANNITCVELEKINGIMDDVTINNSMCNTLNSGDISVSNPIPNPTDGDIILPITLNRDLDYTIAIYNSIGQIQYEETTKKGIEGLNFVTLPTSSYARGCYIIKIMIDGKVFIKKFIEISNE